MIPSLPLIMAIEFFAAADRAASADSPQTLEQGQAQAGALLEKRRQERLARLKAIVPEIPRCSAGMGQGAAWKCEDLDGKPRTCVKIRCSSDACEFSASNVCY